MSDGVNKMPMARSRSKARLIALVAGALLVVYLLWQITRLGGSRHQVLNCPGDENLAGVCPGTHPGGDVYGQSRQFRIALEEGDVGADDSAPATAPSLVAIR